MKILLLVLSMLCFTVTKSGKLNIRDDMSKAKVILQDMANNFNARGFAVYSRVVRGNFIQHKTFDTIKRQLAMILPSFQVDSNIWDKNFEATFGKKIFCKCKLQLNTVNLLASDNTISVFLVMRIELEHQSIVADLVRIYNHFKQPQSLPKFLIIVIFEQSIAEQDPTFEYMFRHYNLDVEMLKIFKWSGKGVGARDRFDCKKAWRPNPFAKKIFYGSRGPGNRWFQGNKAINTHRRGLLVCFSNEHRHYVNGNKKALLSSHRLLTKRILCVNHSFS